jgi:hypothetical protein
MQTLRSVLGLCAFLTDVRDVVLETIDRELLQTTFMHKDLNCQPSYRQQLLLAIWSVMQPESNWLLPRPFSDFQQIACTLLLPDLVGPWGA